MIKTVTFAFCLFFISPLFVKETYYVSAKGIYVSIRHKNDRIMVPYKENESFYFSLKNDSIAIIEESYQGKLKKRQEYKVSSTYDSVFVKHFSSVNGKTKVKVEKVLFKKVWK
jgi:hypothetical protein